MGIHKGNLSNNYALSWQAVSMETEALNELAKHLETQ